MNFLSSRVEYLCSDGVACFVLLGLMTGNLDCMFNPSLFDDSLICRDMCCRNDEESEDHWHLSTLMCFESCQAHVGLLLTN